MLHERAALAYALVSSDLRLYPKRILLAFLPVQDRDFGPHTLAQVQSAIAACNTGKATAPARERAFLEVLVQDAATVLRFLEGLLEKPPYDPRPVLESYFEVAGDYLGRKLGLPWVKIGYSIHSRYPPPMEWQDTYAFTARRPISDEITPGVYYKKDHLFPGLVEVATLHENVHVATPAPITYHSIDNGIADFLAFAMYYDYTQDTSAIRAYSDYLAEVSPTLTEYPKYFRLIASLVQYVGIEAFFRLVLLRMNEPNRFEWRDLLERCRLGTLRTSELPDPGKGDLPTFATKLGRSATHVMAMLSYPDIVLITSPLAYVVLQRIASGDATRTELAAGLGLTADELAAACDELVDLRLINSKVESAAHVLYMRPTDRFVASTTLGVLGPTALRVAPDVAVSGSAAARIERLFHTYMVATAARG